MPNGVFFCLVKLLFNSALVLICDLLELELLNFQDVFHIIYASILMRDKNKGKAFEKSYSVVAGMAYSSLFTEIVE